MTTKVLRMCEVLTSFNSRHCHEGEQMCALVFVQERMTAHLLSVSVFPLFSSFSWL